MNEPTAAARDSFVVYEYKEVTTTRDKQALYADGYPNFGWEPEKGSFSGAGFPLVSLKFKRDRRIRNKAELARLQRQFETGVTEIGRLEKTKASAAMAVAITVGVIGTALLAGAAFAFLSGHLTALMILLAVPGFVGWFLPYLLYKKIRIKKSAAAEKQIEHQYDSLYDVCSQGHALLAEQF